MPWSICFQNDYNFLTCYPWALVAHVTGHSNDLVVFTRGVAGVHIVDSIYVKSNHRDHHKSGQQVMDQCLKYFF